MAGGAHLCDQELKQLLINLQKILEEPFRFLIEFLSQSIQMCALNNHSRQTQLEVEEESRRKVCDIPLSVHKHVKRALVCYFLMVYANLIPFCILDLNICPRTIFV